MHNSKDCTENTFISVIDTNFTKDQRIDVVSIKNVYVIIVIRIINQCQVQI